jgi:hypothetical protein
VEKLNIPIIALREMVADLGAVKGTFEALSLLESELSAHPERKFVAVDTISQLADLWGEFFGRTAEDKWAVFRGLSETHTRFYNTLVKICVSRGVVPLTLSHSKARLATADVSETQKKSFQAERISGGGDIGLDIDGSGRRVYIDNASLQFAMRCRIQKGKPNQYTAHPRGFDGFEGKDRLSRILNDEEQPNLRAILDRIEAASQETKE